MDRHARTPDPLQGEGEMIENWRNWREDFLIFMTVTEYNKKSNELKANLLKNLIGKVGLTAINSFTYTDPADKDDFGVLLSKLDNYFDPPKTEAELRYKFFTRARKGKETIDEYVSDLREKAKVCNFGSISESLVRDRVIHDTTDKALRTKYLAVETLTVEKLMSICKKHESMVQKTKEATVSNDTAKSVAKNDAKKNTSCWRCARTHPPKNCPAWSVKCEKCGEKNHFSHCCQQSKGNEKNKNLNKNLLESFYLNNTAGKATK